MLSFRPSLLAVLLGVFLASCGGGGTGSATVQPTAAAPAITAQPTAQTAILGQAAVFSVVATGSPAPTYQWLKNGNAIADGTSASYHTPATTKADQGALFAVVVTNASGTVTSSPAVPLAVQWAPAITAHPQNQTVTATSAATFTVAVDGNPSPSILWQRNGQSITLNGTSLTYTTPATSLAGSSTDNGSTYLALLTNTVGTAQSNAATLTVLPLPIAVSLEPNTPLGLSVMEGQSTQFEVVATGTAPLTYQWFKGSVGSGTAIVGATSATLPFSKVQVSDAGTYYVVVNNPVNVPRTSRSASLVVTAAQLPPSISTQTPNLAVTEGNQATFQVVATGTPTLSYRWEKNGNEIQDSSNATAGTPNLVLTTLTLADSGAQFRCRISNAVAPAGVYSTPATLTVLPSPNPPVIASFNATPAVIVLGQALTLSWNVTAARTLSLDHGVGDVTGSTSKPVTPTQAGELTYTLTATNGAGSSTASKVVTVNAVSSQQLTVDFDASISTSSLPSSGNHAYLQGAIVDYNMAAAPGFVNLQVTVDEQPVPVSGTIVMAGDHVLRARAQRQVLTVTATAGPNGSITPGGVSSVPYGADSPTFTITPSPGYVINDVQLGGVSVGQVGSYTIRSVTGNRTLSATFVQTNRLTITMGAGVAGYPATGDYRVDRRVDYFFWALPGYEALTLVNETGRPSAPSGWADMQVPRSLTVSAQLKNLTIHLIQDVYGDTVGPVSVPYGLIPTYTFIPKPGYKLDQVLIDTVPVAITPLLQYTFPAPVTIDHTIQPFFKPLP
jgi:Immunoglobulin domain/Immunoglobulin I-set domain